MTESRMKGMMNGMLPPDTRRGIARHLALFIAACFLLLARTAAAALTFASTSAPVFYTDTSVTPQLTCMYRSYNITSDTALTDAWANIESLSGFLSVGGGDDGKFHLGPFTLGQTKAAFFYICSSYTVTNSPATNQGFSVRVYDRDPALASPQLLGQTTSTFDIDNGVIQANPNSVSVIFSGPNPGTLGGIITMTVKGETGTIGCTAPSSCTGAQSGPLAFTPASFSTWRADAYEMIGSNVLLSGGNSGSYDNTLYIPVLGASSNTAYTATFYFRAMSTTSVTTTLSPIGYIASGTQMKHTSTTNGAYSGSGGLLPIEPASNTVVLGRKLVSASTLPAQGGRVTYTLEFTNSGSAAVTLDSVYDILPAGAVYVSGSSSFNGTPLADPVSSGSTRIWSGSFSLPANSVRNLVFQVDLPTPGTYQNTATARIGSSIIDTTLTVGDNVPATATTVVLQAPVIAKSFAPTARAVNGNSLMTLTLSNPNGSQALTGIAFSDTYPAGLVNASPSGIGSTCSGGTPVTASNSVAISGVTLAAGASCTITVNVTSASAGTYNNTTGTISAGNGGTGNTAAASVTFTTLPTVQKAFGAATIPRSGSTPLTLTVTNNGSVGITDVQFTDLFPSGLVLASPTGLTPASPCGGTLESWNGSTASALATGAGGLRLSGGSIATPGTSCSFSVDVTSATAGVYDNITSGVDSSLGTTGPVSNTATLVVMAPPVPAKAFSPATMGKGQTSRLTITLTNPNTVAIAGATFTDTYPALLVNAGTPNATTTCSSGVVTAAAAGGSLALSGATIPASGSCTVSVDVTSNTVNNSGYVNTLAVGGVTTTNTPASTAAATATLIVNATPTITKAFTVDTTGVTTTLTLTILNNHTAGISGLSFSDSFPAGMVVDPTPTLSNTCGGTVSGATAGSATLALAGGAIAAAGGSCTVSLRVRVNSGGVYSNQATGVTMTAPFSGTGSASNIASIIAPIVIKSFSPQTVGPNDVSRMTLQITNPSPTTALSGLALADNYPAGNIATTVFMQNAPTPALSNTCNGTVTATAGASALTLTGGTLAAGQSCIISVNVRANPTAENTYYNVTGRIRSNQGIGASGADALYIVIRPTISKSFLQNPITLTGAATTVLTITVENNYSAAISGMAFTDPFPSLPAQMRYVNTVSNSCGGTLTDAVGAALVANTSTGIRLTGASIAAGSTCAVQVTISVPTDGSYDNITTGATATSPAAFSTPGPASNTATLISNLTSVTVTKSFSAAEVAVNGLVTLSITLTNPNTATVRGLGLTDTYPGTMVNASTPNVTNTCSGSATASAGEGSLSLTGGSLAAGTSCTLTVQVTATAAGLLTNSTGPVTATNAVTATAATAQVTFYAPPTLAKSFSAASYGIGQTGTMTLLLTNPGTNPGTLSTVQVTDDLALSGLAVASATVTFTPAACGSVAPTAGGALAAGDTDIRFSVASLTAGSSCQGDIAVTNSILGALTNTTRTPSASSPAGVTTTGSVATANFSVVQATLSKAWGSASVGAGGGTSLVFTLANGSGNPAQGGIGFVESLPASLRFTASPVVTFGSGCSGSSSVSSGTPDSISFSNVAMTATTASCTVTVASVSNRPGQLNPSCASSPADFTNASGNLSGLLRLTNGVTSQCLVVYGVASLSMTKSVMVFSDPLNLTTNPKSIPGAVSAYTLRITNSGQGAVDTSTLLISDPLPAEVDLYVGDIGSAGSGPVQFSNGTPASGLGWTFTALGNGTDSVDFSQDGSDWSYTPLPDANGFDPLVRHIRLKPTGAMSAASVSGNPYAEFQFRVRIR